jgi:hypothetical protein
MADRIKYGNLEGLASKNYMLLSAIFFKVILGKILSLARRAIDSKDHTRLHSERVYKR